MRIITRKDVVKAEQERSDILEENARYERQREEYIAQLEQASVRATLAHEQFRRAHEQALTRAQNAEEETQDNLAQMQLAQEQLQQAHEDEHSAQREINDRNNKLENNRQKLRALAEERDINNTYTQKVQGYIPAAIVAAYLSFDQLIKSAVNIPTTLVYLLVFAILLVLTPFYVWCGTTKKVKSISWTQIAVATIAFVAWVFASGGPFTALSWYQPFYGGVVLIGFTLLVPLVVQTD